MRVVQLLTQPRGGPVDHAADVAVALARRGVDSRVVGPPGQYADRLRAADVPWHEARVDRALDAVGARTVGRLLDELRPDVVHAQDRRAGLVARLTRVARRRRATVYTLHGVPDALADLVPGNLRCGVPSRRDRFAYLTAERHLARISRSTVVTPCEALARYVRDHVGVPAGRIAVVPNGIPVPPPVAAVPPGPADDRPVTAVWLGLMQPVKRVPALVHSVADVPGLRLRLVGDGPERPAVEAAVRVTGTADRVELVGYVADPAAELAAADLLVLPSAAEACPLAVLRALAAGLPVVASRAGGIPEIVRDGVDGLLVPTGDDEALAAAVRTLVAEPALRRRMGLSGRRRLRERFTVEQCAARLHEVYEEMHEELA